MTLAEIEKALEEGLAEWEAEQDHHAKSRIDIDHILDERKVQAMIDDDLPVGHKLSHPSTSTSNNGGKKHSWTNTSAY